MTVFNSLAPRPPQPVLRSAAGPGQGNFSTDPSLRRAEHRAISRFPSLNSAPVRQAPLATRTPIQQPLGRRFRLEPNSNAFTVLLALVTAMQAIGTIFTLPSIATDFGSTPDRAKLTLSLYLGGFACGQILFGALSDRHGRRPVLLFTLAGVG